MNGAAVVLVTVLTSAATSVGTVYLTHRLHLFDEAPKQETVPVPNLEGLDEDRATSFAGSLGLIISIEGHEESSEQPVGNVVRQTLKAGQMVAKGEKVGIVLAKAVPIPSVVGMSLPEGKKTLEDAGCEIEVEEIENDSVPAGKIASQKPQPGASTAKERTVSVQVSLGPSLVEVPKLTGISRTKALKALEDLGLEAKVRWVDLPETFSGVVLSQKPAPEEKVEKGSSVEFVINN